MAPIGCLEKALTNNQLAPRQTFFPAGNSLSVNEEIPSFYKTRSSLPYSQKPTISLCTERGNSIAHRRTLHNKAANKGTLHT
jgi:hypothetical protein